MLANRQFGIPASRHTFRTVFMDVMGGAVAVATLLCFSAAVSVGTAGERPADSNIVSAVETEMLLDSSVPYDTVDVETRDGIVTLAGTVDNILARDRLEAIAETVVGVRAVVNIIEVRPSGIADADIEEAVKNAWRDDPATDSYELEARVEDGVVTITGTVESWQERELAETVAKGVKGVRETKNEAVITYPTERADAEIESDVESRLANDIRVDDYLIEVSVQDGNVTLRGTVGSSQERTRAQADAWEVGVKSVHAEDLQVEWWARDTLRRKALYAARTDEEIEQAIKDAFLYDPRVLSFNPDVFVEDGTVTLGGVVDNLAAKKAAGQDARNVVGVWRVKNHIKVRPETIPPDEELEKRVQKALRGTPYTDLGGIRVTAHSGTICLEGKVPTSFLQSRAERVAENVKGVTRVINDLDYDHRWTWKPDEEIRQDVKDQFLWSPFVDGSDVSVFVDNGEVTLSGTVATWGERDAAETNAYQGGAKHVQNRLTVIHRMYGPYPEGRAPYRRWPLYERREPARFGRPPLPPQNTR